MTETHHLTQTEQRILDRALRDSVRILPEQTTREEPWTELDRRRLARLEWLYEGLARAECRRQGIDPDADIADGGHLAWHLVGYEAARKEMPGRK